MNLYERISNGLKGKNVKIGLVVVNDKGEVLLIKEHLGRINTTIYNLPTIDINDLKEEKIINEFNKKYNLKISKLSGYINQTSLLDENCKKIQQINLYTTYDRSNNSQNQKMTQDLSRIEENGFIPENVKDILEIFQYNKVHIKNNSN